MLKGLHFRQLTRVSDLLLHDPHDYERLELLHNKSHALQHHEKMRRMMMVMSLIRHSDRQVSPSTFPSAPILFPLSSLVTSSCPLPVSF